MEEPIEDNNIKIGTRQKDIFISGKYVNLKVLNESDVLDSNWYDWFNDEETTMFMQQHYFPNTKEKQLEFFHKEINGSDKKLQLGICSHDSEEPIFGTISLQNIEYINRKAEISMLIGDKKYRKVKYTLEAVDLMLRHGFETLNLNRIYGGTLIQELAELLCRSFGFKEEGVFRQDVFKNGKYADIYFVALLRDEFKKHNHNL